MANQDSEIFVVDDDPSVRDALRVVFELEGFRVSVFPDGAAFLAAIRTRSPECVLLDVHMPGRSGLDVLNELGVNFGAPVFMISGQGDIPMAVEAIKHGAHDFLEKPFDADTIVTRVREALEARANRGGPKSGDPILAPFLGEDQLTPREREVLERIALGASNKEAGRQLGISPRTIEVHRARIMEKLGARNTADLVRIVYSDARRN
ncbi:response regulator [Alsobacter sp. SYSU M60028]|uniref:Response regulator n=1 Tax=Alsobacter ponti TaxID=2962936 RepID=A0ABT1LEU0_9HYPH|nr:response regulator [Alsobacter ponti]MCP8940012.1 response regulator [Alsobacter ponti]